MQLDDISFDRMSTDLKKNIPTGLRNFLSSENTVIEKNSYSKYNIT